MRILSQNDHSTMLHLARELILHRGPAGNALMSSTSLHHPERWLVSAMAAKPALSVGCGLRNSAARRSHNWIVARPFASSSCSRFSITQPPLAPRANDDVARLAASPTATRFLRRHSCLGSTGREDKCNAGMSLWRERGSDKRR